MDWKQQLGEKIAKARRLSGMTQEALATATELSRNTIGHYERGERAPDFSDLVKIAVALKAERFELDENVRIEVSRNGNSRPVPVPQQLELSFDEDGGVTVRIESVAAGLMIKKISA